MLRATLKAHGSLGQDPPPASALNQVREAYEHELLPWLGPAGGSPDDGVHALRNFICHSGSLGNAEADRLLIDAGHERRAAELFHAQAE